MKRGADWLAWSLQFVVGLVVGAFIGLAIISRSRSFGGGLWLVSEQVSTFICGMALIGGGLASFFGDQLWVGSTYRVIPPDGIKHSSASRIVSVVTGVLGGILALTSVLQHFGSEAASGRTSQAVLASKWQPGAVIPHAGIFEGGVG